MRRQLIVIAALTAALGATACATGNGTVQISPSSVPAASGSPAPDGNGAVTNPSGSLPPTGPPGVTGSITHGQGSLTLTGGVTQTTSFTTLGTPAIWSPMPGAMTLSWAGVDPVESMSVGGPSFSGQQSTSASLTFALSVKTVKGTLAFRSQAGECTITLNPATEAQVGGVVFCTNLKSVDGGVTVNVQGSFSAAG